jgi:hypothetical protein
VKFNFLLPDFMKLIQRFSNCFKRTDGRGDYNRRSTKSRAAVSWSRVVLLAPVGQHEE